MTIAGLAVTKAVELLAEHGVTAPPIPVEAIVRARGIKLARNRFDGAESGFALLAKGVRVIGVNTQTSPRRQRFAIAHSLGHMVLHVDRPLIVDHSIVLDPVDKASAGSVDEEVEANIFAAALLIPQDMILRELRRGLAAGMHDSRDALIGQAARTFAVSTEAMGYRLIGLGMISG